MFSLLVNHTAKQWPARDGPHRGHAVSSLALSHRVIDLSRGFLLCALSWADYLAVIYLAALLGPPFLPT
jgi:hypothetical protein